MQADRCVFCVAEAAHLPSHQAWRRVRGMNSSDISNIDMFLVLKRRTCLFSRIDGCDPSR